MFFSPKTSADGLVFHYDTGNTVRSYLGEPTTNLALFNIASSGFGTDTPSNLTQTSNDTQYTYKGRPSRKMVIGDGYWNCYIFSYNNGVSSTVFTVSFKVKAADGSNPSTFIGEGYIYGTAGSFFPSPSFTAIDDGWYTCYIQYSGTAMTLNSLTGVNGSGGPKTFYITDYQVEAKSHFTPFTPGDTTRSATQGLKDLTAVNTINLSNSSFNSSAEIIFDGTDDYINLTSFNPTFTAGITMECVAKWTTNPGGGWQRLFDFGNGAGIDNLLFCRYSSEDRLFFGVYNGGTTSYVYSNVGAIRFGVYATYTAVADGTNFKIYINGVQIYSEANSTVPVTVARANSYLGKSNWPDSYFNGEIPVAKIYNRALTADEVARNYNAIKSRFNIG